MSVAQLKELKAVITAKAVANPTHLCAELAVQFGVSRSTMGKWLRALIDEGWITRQGSRSHHVYKPSLLRHVNRSYPLAGLDEQTPWERDFAPCFELAPNVARLAHHAAACFLRPGCSMCLTCMPTSSPTSTTIGSARNG